VPDRNLGSWVAEQTDKEIILWEGHCYVHTRFDADALRRAKALHPEAMTVVHPECEPAVRQLADHVCSTSGMVTWVERSPARTFLIGTENGLIDLLRQRFPDRTFFAVPPGGTCVTMKRNRLELILAALREESPVIRVPADVAGRAKRALDRMLEVMAS